MRQRHSQRPRLPLRTLATLALAASPTIVLPGAARATDHTFAASNAFWDDPNNWSPNGVPTADDSALINIAGASYLTGDQHADDVTLNSGFLEILSSNNFNYATLTAAGDVDVNAGHLQLIGQDGYYSQLNATTIDIAGGAFFDIKPLADNTTTYYNVNGTVANNGTTAIDGSTYFGTSAVINTNTMTVGSGATASLASNSFFQAAGSLALGGASTLYIVGGGFAYSGGSISNTAPAGFDGLARGSAGAISLISSTLILNVPDGGGATFSLYGTSTVGGDIPVNTTVDAVSNSYFHNLTVNLTDQAHIKGTLNLHSNNGLFAKLACSDPDDPAVMANFINDGTLNLLTDGSGFFNSVLINGHMTNTGVVNASVDTTLGGNVTNTGAFNVDPGVSLTANYIRFNQNAGTLGNSGSSHLFLTGSTFNYNGGRVYLPIDAAGTLFNFAVADTFGLVINATDSNDLGTDLPANTIFHSTAAGADGTLYVPSFSTNHGHILFHADGGWSTHLYARPTGSSVFTNSSTLDFDTDASADATQSRAYVNATLFNYATINSNVDLYLQDTNNYGNFNVGNNSTIYVANSAFTQYAGYLGNSPFNHLHVQNGTFNYSGGAVYLTVDLEGASHLTTATPNGHSAVFSFLPGSNAYIDTDVAPNTFVSSHAGNAADGNSYYSNVFVADTASNDGNLTISATDGYSNNLYVGDGVNYRDYYNHGTLTFNADPKSSITVWGRLTNYGTLNASGDITFTGGLNLADNSTINTFVPSTHVAIQGPIAVIASSLITQDGGSLITQDGGGIVAQGGGNLVAQGGGNIVAQGGGNIVAQGGGNIVAQGGGNIVAQGGGNISVQNGQIVAQGGGNLLTQDGGSLVSHDGGSLHIGFGSFMAASFVGHNGSAAPSGVLASASTTTTTTNPYPQASIIIEPNSTVSLEGGALRADNLVRLDPGATLTGTGSITAGSMISGASISPAPGGTITINAPLTLTDGSIEGPAGSVSVNNTLTLATPGPFTVHAAALSAASLTITAPATLDLTTTPLTLSAISPADLVQLITSHTLFSSTADADPQHLQVLGYLSSPFSTLVKATWLGDANLDGAVNADDYALLDRGLLTAGSLWSQGDFNYDGQITSADFLAIDTTYLSLHPAAAASLLTQRDAQFGPDYVSALRAAVPEPTSFLAACGLAILPLTRRRR